MDECFAKRRRPKKHPNVNKDKFIHLQKLHKLLKLFTNYTHKGRAERTAAKKYIQHIHDIQNSEFTQKEIT